MSTTLVWWVLGLALAGFIGWATHKLLRDVRWWPLVGPYWRRYRHVDYDYDDGYTAPTVVDLPVILTRDEWDALDPDTAADTLIAEWHDERGERQADTDTMGLLDDQELLLWDCRKQLERIRTIRDEYRTEMAGLLAQYRAELEHRGAA